MAKYETRSVIKYEQMLAPVAVTADADSASIDTLNHESLDIVALVGASGDTISGTVKIAFILWESDDDSTFTAVAAGDMKSPASDSASGLWHTT